MKIFINFAWAVLAVGLSQATSWAQLASTVHIEAAVGQPDVVTSTGTPVANGNAVQIGFFNSGFDVQLNGANLAALSGAWHLYGSTEITSLFGIFPGRFVADLSTNSLFNAQRIWLWIFDTIDDSAPTLNNVTEYGLYSSTNLTWAFPNPGNPPPFNSTAIFSDEVNQAAWGSFDPNHLTLAPVPEPPTYALIAIGMGTLLLNLFRRLPFGGGRASRKTPEA